MAKRKKDKEKLNGQVRSRSESGRDWEEGEKSDSSAETEDDFEARNSTSDARKPNSRELYSCQ